MLWCSEGVWLLLFLGILALLDILISIGLDASFSELIPVDFTCLYLK